MTDDRESGVEFGPLAADLEALGYPLSNAKLVERLGDREVVHANGTTTLGEVLGSVDDRYDSAEEVRQTVFSMIGDEAVGRERYSDRAGSTPDDPDGQESL